MSKVRDEWVVKLSLITNEILKKNRNEFNKKYEKYFKKHLNIEKIIDKNLLLSS